MSTSTPKRLVPAYIVQHKKGGYYSRFTNEFDATKDKASPLSGNAAGNLLANLPDGTLTVTPVDGKPLVR
jgi:hypothetical protein